MKVTINQETKTFNIPVPRKSFFSRRQPDQVTTTFFVEYTLEFTNEEKAVLTKYNLWDMRIASWLLPLDFSNPDVARLFSESEQRAGGQTEWWTVRDFATTSEEARQDPSGKVVPTTRGFSTPAEASEWTAKLKNEYMPQIKNLIANVGTSSGSSEKLEF